MIRRRHYASSDRAAAAAQKPPAGHAAGEHCRHASQSLLSHAAIRMSRRRVILRQRRTYVVTPRTQHTPMSYAIRHYATMTCRRHYYYYGAISAATLPLLVLAAEERGWLTEKKRVGDTPYVTLLMRLRVLQIAERHTDTLRVTIRYAIRKIIHWRPLR